MGSLSLIGPQHAELPKKPLTDVLPVPTDSLTLTNVKAWCVTALSLLCLLNYVAHAFVKYSLVKVGRYSLILHTTKRFSGSIPNHTKPVFY